MQTQAKILEAYIKGPLPLTPDNFTPLVRTPWGGQYICQELKNTVCPDKIGERIGESWDFSCEPSFPSKVLGTSLSLNEMIQAYPDQLLSKRYVQNKGHAVCEILVKILNALEDLSLQVHPADDDPFLKKDECGKHESWFILHAEKNAGIYLGFKEGVTAETFANALRSGENLQRYLQFVPVKAGDYFEIPTGTCHALGKGLVIIEPQHVLFSKKGKTYRIYDWGRKYNSKGERDPNGSLRELHVEEALRILNPENQCGNAFLKTVKLGAKVLKLNEECVVETYGENAFYKSHRVTLRKKQILNLNIEDGFGALIPIQGTFSLCPEGGKDSYWQKGQPGFLPAASFPLRVEALEDCILFIVSPSSAKESWSC